VRAVQCTNTRLEVVELPTPRPAPGQLLLQVLHCGICGSDLHARQHCDQLAAATAEVGYHGIFRSDQSVVFGHEFSGEILEHGRRSRRSLPTGTQVVAFPLLRRGTDIHTTGLSPAAPGGYAEQVLVQEALTFAIPNGLGSDLAALTEPLAVGLHAVRRSQISKGQVAVVIGCGPVGLAVICMLKAHGVRSIIASDLSPARRRLAAACGADHVVDPIEQSPYDNTSEAGHLRTAPEVFELAVGSTEKLRRIPLVPWWRVVQAAETLGLAKIKHPVVFECVGVPGMIGQVLDTAPFFARVIVVGVCMQADQIRPIMGIHKEIDLRFVLGYTPAEFRETLHLLADGNVRPDPIITGTVGLDGVQAAFTALTDPETHAKILIDPTSTASTPASAAAPLSPST